MSTEVGSIARPIWPCQDPSQGVPPDIAILKQQAVVHHQPYQTGSLPTLILRDPLTIRWSQLCGRNSILLDVAAGANVAWKS